MPHIDDMIESKYLKKSDVEPAKLVTIRECKKENIAQDNQPAEYKFTLYFNELAKPLVLNSTNIHATAVACDAQQSEQWIGKTIVLFVDPNVSYMGKVIGGIRVRKPKPGAQVTAPQPTASADEFDDDVPF